MKPTLTQSRYSCLCITLPYYNYTPQLVYLVMKLAAYFLRKLARYFLLLTFLVLLLIVLHDHTTHQLPRHKIPELHVQNYQYPVSKNHFRKRPWMSSQMDSFLLSFRDNFSFPQPRVMRPLAEVDSSKFLQDLRHFLLRYKSERPLALITSNYKYVDVLLNWLISATIRSAIPLDSIVILSLDTRIHDLLTNRGIPSILTIPSELIKPDIVFNKTFDQIMMVRLTAMRIVSHFGFDVVMYDTDAIILKDPQPLYDRLYSDDIIGSVGRIPYDLLDEWGITICIGVVLVRSSHLTGIYTCL